MSSQSRDVNSRADLEDLERACVAHLPAVLLPLLSARNACPCSALAIYRAKGLKAAEEYLEGFK